jgi:dTDP-4-amino-4,6-dideoxygalactose transaminase/ubiquinone/menaquinone biosynthesis C-methylase UbiE
MVPRFKPSLNWRELISIFKLNRGAVEVFENEFAKKFDAIGAVAFPYGRSAQWAFFKAIGIENSEIIMPAYTCSVVAHAVTLSGNIPRFIDIDLYDYNMNLDLAEKAISEKTRAIIATHTFGYPQDLDRLESIVKKAEKKFGHKIWLIQDCCHAFGAQWRGRLIGTSGDVAVYAFNISKIITSIFGGILTFQDKDLEQQIRHWRDIHFNKPSYIKSFKRRLYLLAVYITFNERVYAIVLWLQKNTKYLNRLTKAYHLDDKIHFPQDYQDKMTNFEASIGLEQIKKYDNIVNRRIKNAHWYNKNLEKRPNWKFPPVTGGATFSHYVIRVPERNSVLKEYLSKGIELGNLIQYSIPHLNSYKNDRDEKCQNSLIASKQLINFSVCTSNQTNEFDQHWEHANFPLPSRQKLEKAKEFLKKLVDLISSSNVVLNILDAGCGDGVHAIELSKATESNFKYIGIDISKNAIEKCKQRLIGDPRFKFMECDIMDLEHDPHKFDVIISYGVIAYTKNPTESIKKLSKLLKVDGLFFSWIYETNLVTKFALVSLRTFCKLVGEVGTNYVASIIVFLMRFLPISSGVNLKNSTFTQCKETVLVNIKPTILWLPSKKLINHWFHCSDLTEVQKLTNCSNRIYIKK